MDERKPDEPQALEVRFIRGTKIEAFAVVQLDADTAARIYECLLQVPAPSSAELGEALLEPAPPYYQPAKAPELPSLHPLDCDCMGCTGPVSISPTYERVDVRKLSGHCKACGAMLENGPEGPGSQTPGTRPCRASAACRLHANMAALPPLETMHKRSTCAVCGFEWLGKGAGPDGDLCPLVGCPGARKGAP